MVIGLLGGGESSSPSIGFDPQKHSLRVEAPDQAVDVPEGAAEGVNEGQGKEFPETSYEDNVRLQYQLLRKLGVEKVWAYVGFSMGVYFCFSFALSSFLVRSRDVLSR